MISYGKQWISEEDISAVIDTLKSDFLTQGPKVKEFEDAICRETGAKYCVVVANGTAALHIAVASLELSEGREGITSTNTFTASATSMVFNGLKPVFADIDSRTYNVTPETLRSCITDKTSLLIPVHFAGQPCDMKEIGALAKEKGLSVIEDGAHALASSYLGGDSVGSCRYSDMTIFSFHPVKTLTTAEGGAITTNRKDLYEKMLLLRSHGITKSPELLGQNPGPWYYEMQSVGYNYRMCDMQAALGVSQINRLKQFKERRREIVDRYNRELSGLDWLVTPFEREELDSCFHLYVPQFDFTKIGKTRTEVMIKLWDAGVGTQVHYIPVHIQPYYSNTWNTVPENCPVALSYYEKALSLPLYPLMSEDDQTLVIKSIKNLVG